MATTEWVLLLFAFVAPLRVGRDILLGRALKVHVARPEPMPTK